MENKLEHIYFILNQVLPNNVYYALQVKDNATLPFIVYQELNKRSTIFADDSYLVKQSTIQITLITSNKDLELEKKLENIFCLYDIEYQMISEYFLNDSGIYRIYEIKMEEYKYEQQSNIWFKECSLCSSNNK